MKCLANAKNGVLPLSKTKGNTIINTPKIEQVMFTFFIWHQITWPNGHQMFRDKLREYT